MHVLTDELLNRYQACEEADDWGRIEYPRRSWKEFNEIGIEEARNHLRSVLTEEDYRLVRQTACRLFDSEAEQPKKYVLHGDTGVHNFVYRDSKLIGVIDPSPMAGPILYDFLYAFCSSPDDLNMETLLTAFDTLQRVRIERSRLIEEVLIQLYCRIGLSVRHHPHDLPGYLEAWTYWTALCRP
ncbi:phosphotransferase [Saccharibacillus sacchari]|uniref:Phosphotransferase n=1 Tax=Saccharibacillus sacchari TaxID=456493 RepID=A0ACC6PAF9_9BACL